MHRGFLKTWMANGLDKELTGRLKKAIEKMQTQGKPGKVKLYVTGVH